MDYLKTTRISASAALLLGSLSTMAIAQQNLTFDNELRNTAQKFFTSNDEKQAVEYINFCGAAFEQNSKMAYRIIAQSGSRMPPQDAKKFEAYAEALSSFSVLMIYFVDNSHRNSVFKGEFKSLSSAELSSRLSLSRSLMSVNWPDEKLVKDVNGCVKTVGGIMEVAAKFTSATISGKTYNFEKQLGAIK